MNQYKVIIKGTDIFGVSFLNHVVNMANKGAIISKDHPVQNKFPHCVVMEIATDEELKSDVKNGFEVLPVFISYTKEQLEEMDWAKLKALAKKRNVTGRDRQQLIKDYLDSFKDE